MLLAPPQDLLRVITAGDEKSSKDMDNDLFEGSDDEEEEEEVSRVMRGSCLGRALPSLGKVAPNPAPFLPSPHTSPKSAHHPPLPPLPACHASPPTPLLPTRCCSPRADGGGRHGRCTGERRGGGRVVRRREL